MRSSVVAAYREGWVWRQAAEAGRRSVRWTGRSPLPPRRRPLLHFFFCFFRRKLFVRLGGDGESIVLRGGHGLDVSEEVRAAGRYGKRLLERLSGGNAITLRRQLLRETP